MMKSLITADENPIQSALCFIAMLRNDANLRDNLVASRQVVNVPYLVILGAQYGYRFNETWLRKAFVYDWQMRMAQWQLRTRLAMPVEHQTGVTAKQPT